MSYPIASELSHAVLLKQQAERDARPDVSRENRDRLPRYIGVSDGDDPFAAVPAVPMLTVTQGIGKRLLRGAR